MIKPKQTKQTKKPTKKRSVEGENSSGETESHSDVRSHSRSRSRSRSRLSAESLNVRSEVGSSAGDDFTNRQSKKERRARRKRDRQLMEKGKELASQRLKGGKSGTAAGNNATVDEEKISRDDQIRGSTKDLFVVCADISQSIRMIKKEMPDAEVTESSEMNVEAPADATESLEAELKDITAGLRDLVLSDANKMTRYMAARVLEQAQKYEDVAQRILKENARLQGRVDAYERVVECMSGGMSKLDETVSQMSERVRTVGEVCEKVSTVSAAAPSTVLGSPQRGNRSYAMIVRGANEELHEDEIKKRMLQSIGADVNIRVRAVKPMKGGGVIVETQSSEEGKMLACRRELVSVGLRVEEPRKLDPRIIVYGVPADISDECLLRGMYEKSLSECIQDHEFSRSVRVIKRIAKDGNALTNVIIELPLGCCNKLVFDGRIFVGWNSFKLARYERIPRCFACMGYGHQVKDCQSERLCWKCGEGGHQAAACHIPEDCRNCRLKKMPSGHSAMSTTCPEYVWRLNLLRTRINNG